MAKRKAIEDSGSDAVADPNGASEQTQVPHDLPIVESPSISPATPETSVGLERAEAPAESAVVEAPETDASAPPANVEDSAPAATEETVVPKSANRPRFALRPRHKRYALLAASVAVAAVFGAVVGAATIGGFSKPAAVNAAGVEENKAMQQSVARLAKDIAGLKAGLEAANKSALSQIAKLSERLGRESVEITGSITPPQTTASHAPVPTPRPAPRGAETHPTRLSILADWSIRDTRGGYVYVQGHGDVYQVVPGAPLPGVGPVEQIKRQDGRWVVVTPKGIIVSMRDRRYFEQF